MSVAPSMPPSPPLAFIPKVLPKRVVEEFDPLAFWLFPDWSGGNNMAQREAVPFWMIDPKKPKVSIMPPACED